MARRRKPAIAYYAGTPQAAGRQRRIVTEYARQQGFEIVAEFSDRHKGRRADLARALTLLSEGRAATCLVADADKLAPGDTERQVILALLLRPGADLIACRRGEPVSVPLDVQWTVWTTERLLRESYGHRLRAAIGRPRIGATAGEQQLIARMQQLRGEGLSYQKIADRLHAEGFRTRAGSRFTRQQVFKVLADNA